MKSLVLNLTADPVTADKAARICERDGYKPTGVVLQNDKGERCIVEMTAVRWLSSDEMWALMHPQVN